MSDETPTLEQYINAADWAYTQGKAELPSELGLTRMTYLDGDKLELYSQDTGFYGAALLTSANQIIVTFEGTNLFTGDDIFTAAQIADDTAIFEGITAPSFLTATAFTLEVVGEALLQGYDSSDIFVTGHSLGGADASYVAATLGLGGVAFAPPGIVTTVTPTVSFTSYVDYGDPVGNYANEPPDSMGSIVQDDDIKHYGTQVMIGDPLDALVLQAAATAYADGNDAGALGILAAAVHFHLLGQYASDLGLTLDIDRSAAALGQTLACYAEGTRIATEAGDRPIETLRPGDLIRTLDGSLRPVRWTGHRAVRCAGKATARLRPYRVAAGALGPGLPARDLLLSPDHALFVEGVLIPVRYLADGDAIRQAAMKAVTYWHVELDRHAVILAEGLPAESLLPGEESRGAFADGAVTSLRPCLDPRPGADSLRWEALGCARLVIDGPEVARARALLRPTGRRRRRAA
ncbi:MAG: Hint domain-containing protein [Acetobacteraceae bacterium]